MINYLTNITTFVKTIYNNGNDDIIKLPRVQMTPAAPVHWSLVKLARGQD